MSGTISKSRASRGKHMIKLYSNHQATILMHMCESPRTMKCVHVLMRCILKPANLALNIDPTWDLSQATKAETQDLTMICGVQTHQGLRASARRRSQKRKCTTPSKHRKIEYTLGVRVPKKHITQSPSILGSDLSLGGG